MSKENNSSLIMPLRRLRIIQELIMSWNGLLAALLLSVGVVRGEARDACEVYNVELRAVFPNQLAMPCTDEEQNIISALLHSLVQTDVIVGMNSMYPVSPFFLAFEAYGLGAVRLTSFEEHDFTTTQLQSALPHYTIEDELEDLFYSYDTPESAGNETVSPSENNSKGMNSGERKTLITPYEDDFEAIQPFEDSLRTALDQPKNKANTGADDRATFNISDIYNSEQECEADWCGHFFSRPCGSISRSSLQDESPQYQAKLQSFQERAATSIEHKLRKWARDSNNMCLGNSWELTAIVTKL